MNRIEARWLHLKRQELASRIFDDEYDLILAIIQELENRGEQSKFLNKTLYLQSGKTKYFEYHHP